MNKTKHEIEVYDYKSLRRLHDLIDIYYNKMTIINNDSAEGISGGAECYYRVKIEFDEVWLWK